MRLFAQKIMPAPKQDSVFASPPAEVQA